MSLVDDVGLMVASLQSSELHGSYIVSGLPRGFRCLKAADTVKPRRLTHAGRVYVVAPLVVMTAGVRHAVNATGPELIPAEVIAATADMWSGIPIVFRHPEKDGELVSVATEGVQDYVVGFAAAGRWEDERLRVEAWIDVEKIYARSGGPEALATIERGDHLEVSAGAFVEVEAKAGEFGGRQYVGIQRSIVPDHIALLAVNELGACDWDDGCGAARQWARPVAGRQLRVAGAADCKCKHAPPVEAAAEQERTGWLETLKRLTVLHRMGRLIGAGEMSHSAIREALQAALVDLERPRDEEFMWVLDVFTDRVVYARGQETWQRDYTMTKKGVVTLSETRIEVRPETQFAPVAAAGQEAAKMKERIDKLITAKRFEEADREWLAKLTDAQLARLEKASLAAELETAPDGGKPKPKPKPDPDGDDDELERKAAPAVEPAAQPAAQARKPLTESEFLATLPAEYRGAVERTMRAEKEHRGTLVAKLVAHKANKISKERLEAMSVEHLEELVALAGEELPVANFSGRGGPSPAPQPADAPPPAAPKLAVQMAAKKDEKAA